MFLTLIKRDEQMNNFKLTFQKIIILLFLILIISCPNDQMRDLVEIKISDPVADSFIIEDGTPTSTLKVMLYSNVTKEDDALEMRFKNKGYSWSEWEPYSSTKTWTLPLGDGDKTVYAEYRDEGHHVVKMKNIIELSTQAPSGDFYIWGSAVNGNQHAYINSTSVTLCMNITNVEQMRFSNNNSTWSEWEPYSAEKSWTLLTGDGEVTVYAEFMSNSELTNNEPIPNSTPTGVEKVILDTTPPSVTNFQINSGDEYANAIGTTLTYNYTELNAVWAQYRNDGGSWSTAESISGGSETKSWTLKSETGTRTAYARLMDIAGNFSLIYSDDIILSTAAPALPVVTAATPTNDTTPTWSWTSVAGATQYRIQLDSETGNWINVGTDLSWTAGSELAEGTHTLYVQSGDIADKWSSSASFPLEVDTTAPGMPGFTYLKPYYNSSDYTSAEISVGTAGGEAGDTLTLTVTDQISSTVTSTGTLNSSGTYTFYVNLSSLPDGYLAATVFITDRAGNQSLGHMDMTFLDKTPPVITLSSSATPTNDTTPTWSWTASDGASGVYETGYSLDSGGWVYPSTSSYTSNPLTDGTHTFQVRAIDHAGNISVTASSNILIDTTAPAVGNGVATSDIWAFGARLNWGAASDTITPQNSLEYKVVMSYTPANVDTVAHAQANGDTLMDWTANTTSYTVSNLLPNGSNYFFNVLVRDSLGNMDIYTYAPVTTLVRPILLFGTASTHDANLGGRPGADSIVQTEYSSSYSGFGYSDVRCFISVSAADALQNMPGLYNVPTDVPVYSNNGTKIADSWGQLFSTGATDLLSTLYTAGVLSVNGEKWWSGSNEDGSTDGQTCSGWTSATGSASIGSSSRQNITGTNNWIWDMSVAAAGRYYKVLGIAY